jgi:mRNA-degrading endonuclease toxin of MazEF toxin-antitoxin module
VADVHRGEIRQVQFSPATGSEMKLEHPTLILSIDALNASRMPLVTVVPFTNVAPRTEGMLNVRVEPDGTNGLDATSWAQPHLIRLVSREPRLQWRRGELVPADLEHVLQAVRDVMGL